MTMRLFRKNKNICKTKKEAKATRYFRILLWRLFVRLKVRERVAQANRWADKNRGDTMLITVGCLLFSLILGAFLTLGNDDESKENFLSDVEPVEPMFQGMQQIQDTKAYQIAQINEMARKGQTLKHDLDSLVRLSVKTHEDSLTIISKYKQLELIVNNLEKGQAK